MILLFFNGSSYKSCNTNPSLRYNLTELKVNDNFNDKILLFKKKTYHLYKYKKKLISCPKKGVLEFMHIFVMRKQIAKNNYGYLSNMTKSSQPL